MHMLENWKSPRDEGHIHDKRESSYLESGCQFCMAVPFIFYPTSFATAQRVWPDR